MRPYCHSHANFVCTALVCVVASLISGPVFGQGGIGIPTGNDSGFPSTTQQGLQQTQGGQQFGQGQQLGQGQQTGQGQQNQGGSQTGQTSNSNGPSEIDPSKAVAFADIVNTRNQGFVGATATGITERGFVGVPSETSGPPLAEGATFGGGVNSSQPGGASGGAGNFGGQRGGMGGLGGNLGSNQFGGGTQNFFQVQRAGLRGAIKPSFATPEVSNDQIADRFNVSFSRLPQSQDFNGQYQISVNDKRAKVTGWVNTQADANRLIAQLRFQPGIYSIDNQLEIRQK